MKNIVTILLLWSCAAHAQNIVPNPGFAAHTSCPSIPTEINKCTGWTRANAGTPDYFNACDTSNVSGVPLNSIGHQLAGDSAYVGAYAYLANRHFRELITTTIPALTVGNLYSVTLVTSLADRAYFGTNGLGVLFFDHFGLDTFSNTYLLGRAPQIRYGSYGIISDTAHWVTLTKTFVADSAYTHLVFGNFTPDSLLLFDTLDRGPGGYSYYYFDSISVENKTPTGITEVNAPLQITESPNPFTDRCQITIKGAPTSELALLLLDGTGRLVQRIDHLTTGEVTLERHGLPPGGYLYLLRSNEGTLYRGRLLIE
ncbi:MAG: hypothetical protein EBZ77_02170 [Chitinophagia bacterium]|nr:hypothetical protein [Chitinophagia bacterium]